MLQLARRRFIAAVSVTLAGLGARPAAAQTAPPVEQPPVPRRRCRQCEALAGRMIVLLHRQEVTPPGGCYVCHNRWNGSLLRERLARERALVGPNEADPARHA